jgi:hypothetical protein
METCYLLYPKCCQFGNQMACLWGTFFDHTKQLEGSDVSTNSNMELRYKKRLCLSWDIAQAWSFNSICAFLRVKHWQFLLYIMEKIRSHVCTYTVTVNCKIFLYIYVYVWTICLVKADVHIMLKCHYDMKCCCKSRCGYVESESTVEPRILNGIWQ